MFHKLRDTRTLSIVYIYALAVALFHCNFGIY